MKTIEEFTQADIDFIVDEVVESGRADGSVYWAGKNRYYWFGPAYTESGHNVGDFELWLYDYEAGQVDEEPVAKYSVSISASRIEE